MENYSFYFFFGRRPPSESTSSFYRGEEAELTTKGENGRGAGENMCDYCTRAIKLITLCAI